MTALLVVGVTLTACTDESESAALDSGAAQASVTVTTDGFTLRFADVVVTGPAGVASAGTIAKATMTPVPAEVSAEILRPGIAFDLAFDSGQQPSKGVKVSWSGSGKGGSAPVAFITRSSTDGTWSGQPVKRAGNEVSVTMSHFSIGVFGWAQDVVDKVVQGAKKFLGQRYDPPSCAPGGQAKVLDGYKATIEGGDGIYACLERINAQLTLTLHSNSGFVWRITPKSTAGVGLKPEAPLDSAQVATVAAFDALVDYTYAGQTLLVPGGRALVRISGSPPSLTVSARVDASLGLIAVLVAGVQSIPGLKLDAADLVSIGECSAQVVDTATNPDVPSVLETVLDCFALAVEGAAAVVVSILTSLIGALVTQISGLVGEFTGTNSLAVRVALDECAASNVVQGWGADTTDSKPSVKECGGGWAYLDLGIPGDAQSIMRLVDGRWTRYTGLPASICIDDFRRAGGPKRFEKYMSPCQPSTSFELTADGLGPFHVGMSATDVEKRARALGLASEERGDCRIVQGPDESWAVIYYPKSSYYPAGGVNELRADSGFGLTRGSRSSEVSKVPGVTGGAFREGAFVLDVKGPNQIEFRIVEGELTNLRAIADADAGTQEFCS